LADGGRIGDSGKTLVRAFVATLTIGRSIDEERLEERLVTLLAAAERSWPGLGIDPICFVEHLARCIRAADDSLEAALERLHTSDLYLALGCASGERAAIEGFERHFMTEVPRYLSSLRLSRSCVDEAQQLLRAKLLVSAGGRPRIAEYSGRGDLAGWLRVAAIRVAVDLQRQLEAKAARDGKPRVHAPSIPILPELQLFREQYQSQFETAFKAELMRLPVHSRYLLRLHFVEGLSMQAIARLERVDRSTIFRRISAVREQLAKAIERRIAYELDLSRSEVNMLIALVQSQLDMTLSGVL
jgi:RNA polymerase sigma-70 factor (ECF subfamily)